MYVVCKPWEFYFFSRVDSFYFFLLWLPWLGLPKLCWIVVVNWHPCLSHDLRRNVFKFFTIENNVCFGFIVQFSSVAQSCPTLYDPMHCSMPGFLPAITNSQTLLTFMLIELVMPSNQLFLCRPLPLLSSIFSSIRVFSNELIPHIRWPKYWSFSFSISPSNWIYNIQFWLTLGLIGLISLLSNELSRVFSNTTVQKHQFYSTQLSI